MSLRTLLAVLAGVSVHNYKVDADDFGSEGVTVDSYLFKQNAMKISEVTDTGNTQDTFHPSDNFGAPAPTQALRGEAARPLNVFVLPHSHDDPGYVFVHTHYDACLIGLHHFRRRWVRTSDQYFEFFVQHIYSTAVKALSENPKRKFQAVESIYFRQWYETVATEEERKLAYKFINNGVFLVQSTNNVFKHNSHSLATCPGQMQIAVGGWVMPDEVTTPMITLNAYAIILSLPSAVPLTPAFLATQATTDMTHLVQTMTLGHEWLFDTFGDKARPRFGFQVTGAIAAPSSLPAHYSEPNMLSVLKIRRPTPFLCPHCCRSDSRLSTYF